MNVEPLQPYLEPLRKSVTVPRPVAAAFDLFTTRMSTWWPLRTHSVYEDRAVACGIEPCAGGLIYEERDDGWKARPDVQPLATSLQFGLVPASPCPSALGSRDSLWNEFSVFH